MRNTILIGDNRETLKTIPSGSVQCCVSSPPYWGLRDYGTADWRGGDPECDHIAPALGGNGESSLVNGDSAGGKKVAYRTQQYRDVCGKCGAQRVDSQIGLEKTPEEYVAEIVAVYREVWRALRDDGTCWVNLGDSYNAAGRRGHGTRNGVKQGTNRASAERQDACRPSADALKPKDLIGIPWRVAFALQADGWYLRQDLIWAKPNPMPESVTDRCTKAHEYVFLLSKSPSYFYDQEAIKEDSETGSNGSRFDTGKTIDAQMRPFTAGDRIETVTRNRRSVWNISTKPFSGSHFATMPPDLAETCILAGTSAKGACPKCGAPWVRIVERDRVATRPGNDTKVGRVGVHPDSPYHDHAGMICGNRDPQRHTTVTQTTGWEPSCECNAGEPVPCIVLDPFGGAGTTAIVAEGHGRDWILCELNESYANDIAWPRIRQGWSPVTGRAKTPALPGQKSLFAEVGS